MVIATPHRSCALSAAVFAGVLCVTFLLSGCVHHPIDCAEGIYHSDCLAGTAGYQTPADAWYNPALAPNVAESQRTIDNAECAVYAMQAVPLPVPIATTLIPSTRPRGQYQISGSINGEPYNATVSEEPSFDPARSMLEGQQFSESLTRDYRESTQYVAAVHARSNLADACMLKRGWMNDVSGQQPNISSTSLLPAPVPGPDQTANSNMGAATAPGLTPSPDQPALTYDAWLKKQNK